VFDIRPKFAGKKSIKILHECFLFIFQFCKENVVVTLIGNKSDRVDVRQVTVQEAQTVSSFLLRIFLKLI
jgi:hypothetical protein